MLKAIRWTTALSITLMATLTVSARAHPPVPEGYQSGQAAFRTSDRCLACHNGLLSPTGADVSIGFDWRTSVMANSGRDPYWQASVRRESIDHPQSSDFIQDDCATCHMPIARYHAHVRGQLAAVFAQLPLTAADVQSVREYADGVSCAVCHQISAGNLGRDDSFNGGFVVGPPDAGGAHAEYGPFVIDPGRMRIMRSSTGGFQPTQGAQIRSSEMCATCHTLITRALGPGGRTIGSLPEQVPYQEWQHSAYRDTQSCQSCHMPAIEEAVPIARVLGIDRDGVRHHQFIGGNFLLQRLLGRYHDELALTPSTEEFSAAAARTVAFLQSQSARLELSTPTLRAGRLEVDVTVQNLTGHKLPTAYPSRRAWLHVTVRDRMGHTVFESGALRTDGSIVGNLNDQDALRFEPHFNEISSAAQVQIYESILKDRNGAVTTGLLNAVGYLKDNRLLPRGFDKRTADPQIAVYGRAFEDPQFTGGQDRVRYSVAVAGTGRGAGGPYRVEAELLYQPIGYRWASNLRNYDAAAEPQRFNGYYDAMATASTVALAHASAMNP